MVIGVQVESNYSEALLKVFEKEPASPNSSACILVVDDEPDVEALILQPPEGHAPRRLRVSVSMRGQRLWAISAGVVFFDYTAYGDTINVAARLEAANKQLCTCVCVSTTLADKVKGFRGRPIGDLVLRGKTEPLRASSPLGLNNMTPP